MELIENWKEIPNKEGVFVSDKGNVREGCNLRKLSLSHGYRLVRINYVLHKVHRLVATAFIENPEGKPHVNHINGNKSDNRVENLEWATRSENMTHNCRVLKHNCGEINHFSRLSENDVLDIITLKTFGATNLALSKCFGVNYSTITRLFTGKTWRTVCIS